MTIREIRKQLKKLKIGAYVISYGNRFIGQLLSFAFGNDIFLYVHTNTSQYVTTRFVPFPRIFDQVVFASYWTRNRIGT